MLIEAKWSRVTERDQYRILYRLEEAADRIPGIEGYSNHYGLIAREIRGGGPGELWKLSLEGLDQALNMR